MHRTRLGNALSWRNGKTISSRWFYEWCGYKSGIELILFTIYDWMQIYSMVLCASIIIIAMRSIKLAEINSFNEGWMLRYEQGCQENLSKSIKSATKKVPNLQKVTKNFVKIRKFVSATSSSLLYQHYSAEFLSW